MNFYEKYGKKATKEAFGADRKLISKLRKRIKDNNGNLQALIPISTKPDKFRTSTIDYKIIEEIKRIRQEYCEFKLLMQQCKENNKIEGWKDIKGYRQKKEKK